MPKHVFLSYVRENTGTVDRLARELEARGVPVWLDRERLLPGQRWRDAIRDAIGAGDLFIACFSKEYLARDRSYMNEELTVAIEELRQRPASRSWFIPVSIDGTKIPARTIGAGETLQDLHWVDLAERWSGGVELIVQAVLGQRATGESQGTHQGQCDSNPAVDEDAGLLAVDEDAGLLDAGDAFMKRMAAYGDARSRMIAVVVDFYATLMNPPPPTERAPGMVGVREEMAWRAGLLEKVVAGLRTDIPTMSHTFDAAMRQLRITMAVAGEVGLDNSMSSSGWNAAIAKTTETIASDCDELATLRDRLASIGRFTTRINHAKKAAIAEIDRLILIYREQAKTFAQIASDGSASNDAA